MNRVGTGTSVRSPRINALESRIKAETGFSKISTSPTSTFDASAPDGIFLKKDVFPFKKQSSFLLSLSLFLKKKNWAGFWLFNQWILMRFTARMFAFHSLYHYTFFCKLYFMLLESPLLLQLKPLTFIFVSKFLILSLMIWNQTATGFFHCIRLIRSWEIKQND